MYFWRIDRLKDELRLGAVPPRDVIRYAMAHLLLWTLVALIPGEEAPLTAALVVLVIGSSLILIGGLWMAYGANGGDEGRDLAGRLLALSWVLGLRLMVFAAIGVVGLMIVMVAAAMAGVPTADLDEQVVEWSAGAIALLWSILFFWRLGHHLRALRASTTDA